MIRERLLFIAFAFILTNAITAAFILHHNNHVPREAMALSGLIAVARWLVQIGAGIVFLGERRWLYFSQFAATSLTGGLALLPYAIVGGSDGFFFGSIIAALLIMVIEFYRRLKLWHFPMRWYFLWLGLLTISVTLQLKVVFHLI